MRKPRDTLYNQGVCTFKGGKPVAGHIVELFQAEHFSGMTS